MHDQLQEQELNRHYNQMTYLKTVFNIAKLSTLQTNIKKKISEGARTPINESRIVVKEWNFESTIEYNKFNKVINKHLREDIRVFNNSKEYLIKPKHQPSLWGINH